jgi:hypothetical protein
MTLHEKPVQVMRKVAPVTLCVKLSRHVSELATKG